MRISPLLAWTFWSASLMAAIGFVSTIDTRLWGHPWAETAQDVAMFGGLAMMVVSGIWIFIASRRIARS